jgi:hypothetical protein
MDKKTYNSLEAVIEYLYKDELDDYDVAGKPDDHIFNHIAQVDEWIQEAAKEYQP